MMKKLLVSAGALLMVVGLASCGGETTSTTTGGGGTTVPPVGPKDITLKVWGAAAEQSVYDYVATTYNSNPDREYNVTLTFESVGEDVAATEMEKNVAEGADLYFFADDQALKLKKVNALSPVVGSNLSYVNSVATEGGINSATLGGEMVAYPATVSNLWFMYYDKSFYSAEDVLSLETILSKAKEAGKKVSMPFNTGWYILPSFFPNNELYWTQDSEGVISYTTDLDSAETVTAASYLNNLLAGYYKDGTLVIGQDLGGASNSVATLNGSWQYSNNEGTGYLEILGEDNLGLTVTPSYHINGETAVQMKSFLGAKLIGVNGAHDTDHQKAAHELAKIMIGKEASLLRYEAREMIPVNSEALEDERYSGNISPTVEVMAEQAALGGFSQAATIQSQDLWDIFENALGKGLVGNGDENDPETGLIADWAAYLSTQATRIRGLN